MLLGLLVLLLVLVWCVVRVRVLGVAEIGGGGQ